MSPFPDFFPFFNNNTRPRVGVPNGQPPEARSSSVLQRKRKPKRKWKICAGTPERIHEVRELPRRGSLTPKLREPEAEKVPRVSCCQTKVAPWPACTSAPGGLEKINPNRKVYRNNTNEWRLTENINFRLRAHKRAGSLLTRARRRVAPNPPPHA